MATCGNLHDKSGRIRGIYWYWILTQFTANIAIYIEYWIPSRDSKYWQYIEYWKNSSDLEWFWAIFERFLSEFKWFSASEGSGGIWRIGRRDGTANIEIYWILNSQPRQQILKYIGCWRPQQILNQHVQLLSRCLTRLAAQSGSASRCRAFATISGSSKSSQIKVISYFNCAEKFSTLARHAGPRRPAKNRRMREVPSTEVAL